MTKTLSSLVEDIYSTLENCEKISDDDINILSKSIANTVASRLSQSSKRRDHLSLSSIGKPLRRLWYDLKEPEEAEAVPAYYRLKFLYGDIIEDIVLWLAQVSGHDVKDRQREVNHHGVVGHIDSIIDGEVVDIKSASQRSYMKFARGTLPDDDPFGYLAQIQSYDEEVGKGNPAFLVMNKVSGELCLYQPDKDFDLPDTEQLIACCRDALAKDTPPEQRCYPDVPDGKSGNRCLDKGCAFCPYKKRCWPGRRAYNYATGIKYLTHIEKEPKVEEIDLD
jgi:hypothetical protein